MPGPGEYLADATEGITRVEDLPKAKIVCRSRDFAHRACPRCGHSADRYGRRQRTLHDVGDLVAGRPRDMHLSYSVHECSQCQRHFTADRSDLAPPGSHDTHRVIGLAVRLVVEDGLPYGPVKE